MASFPSRNRKSCPRFANLTEADFRAYLNKIYHALLEDPAISGITVGEHWDHIQPDDPVCAFAHSCPDGPGGYNWNYLDDVFTAANAAHKSVQLLINPGVESPTWLMDKLPSYDGLFTGSRTAPFDCGKVTFQNFPEQAHADATNPPLPLPWNPVYVAYWDNFLIHLNERYSSNPAFTYIAMAGPICASTEMILPTTADQSTQISGVPSDQAWQTLIHHSFPFCPAFKTPIRLLSMRGREPSTPTSSFFTTSRSSSARTTATHFPNCPTRSPCILQLSL